MPLDREITMKEDSRTRLQERINFKLRQDFVVKK